ncbi:MAG: VanW family protein [Eubacteriales bacterium]
MKGKFEKPRTAGAQEAKPVKKKTTKAKKPAAKKSKALTVGVPVAIFALILAGAVGIFAYSTSLKSSDTIFPGLSVAGVSVGGLTVEEAIDAVNSALAEDYEIKDLVVNIGEDQLVFSGAELNVTYDVAGAVQLAWEEGRDGSVFDALSRSFITEDEAVAIIDRMSFNEDYVNEVLAEAEATAISEKKNSSYSIDGAIITVTVGSSQRSLNIDTLKETVLVALYSNDYTALEYAYDEVPYEPVDMTAIYNELSVTVEDAYYDKETKTIVPEITGYGFDVEAANQKQMMAEEGAVLTFQLEEMLPEVTMASLEEILFADVLGEYSDSHVWNTARTTNLELAAEAINGTILNPGDEFSFNDIVGERTAAKGYQAASVYVSGNTEAQLGGGVCQVASTIYMATLLADLEVTERTEHMFLVTYVPMGMDATIYWGSLDYKFKNSTDYPIRVDTVVEDGYVTVQLWGTQTADKFVEMSYEVISTAAWKDVTEGDETKSTDYKEVTVTAYTGYKVQTYKQYVDADGNPIGDKEKVAYSNFQSRDRVTTVGTMGLSEEDAEIFTTTGVLPTTDTTTEGETALDTGTTDAGTTDTGTTDAGTTDTGTTDATTPETTTPETTTPEVTETVPETTVTPEETVPETTTTEVETTTPSVALDA